VFSMLIVKVSKFRRSAETGKCSDFYLGQRNARVSVGLLRIATRRNPVMLHRGLKVPHGSG
jgi:hypothetical protein